MTQYQHIQNALKIHFTDELLLDRAFTHRSYLNEAGQKDLESNERLEFLGDAVLELITSLHLYQSFPKTAEGDLTNFRSALVKTDTLAQVARQLNLGQCLKMSKGEDEGGGRDNPSLLANTVEALIGAIFLDQGIDAATKFTATHILAKLPEIRSLGLHHDYKSSLQELVQAQDNPTPTYHVLEETGPDHFKHFTVEVRVGERHLATGSGSSKQRAQQQAAKMALEKISKK